ncbi:RNI-like protein [Parathielavia hyrcaniae]|uniref:RNI-like protein n=1 Tax=Parathielavia hyrcaniae TaxID=113614 RepID=A0AAN6PS51_9PEZI|nr:RNI-like protein [Parathielavia hyrcaniae]
MERQGPSIDIMAGVIDDAQFESLPLARPVVEDSRSTSSSSSPAPPDNEESDFFLGANDSQTSLGVPNIQDMQVNDDECLPPIQRLPNEILIAVFAKLSGSSDLLHIMLTCKRWARNAVDILWHRPSCSTWEKLQSICTTLALENPYFAYRDFVRRLNLAVLAGKVNDGSVMPLAECKRIERLTLTGCTNLTDSGLIALVSNNNHLYSLDVSLTPPSAEGMAPDHISDASINAITENCARLQGLNISGCQRISNESLVRLAQRCRYIKRLNDCVQLEDSAVLAFAEHCPNILEIDLQQCRLIGNEPVTALFTQGHALRELRLTNCEMIDDSAFLSLPPHRVYEHLRILDLSCCPGVTDRAIERIIEVAPRLRNLVLQKCRNLTDAAVYAISRLGKNLHYLHLGHCNLVTDDGVKRLVSMCNRIRYIDLGCCTNLTDDSVTKLANLPKLKRIGLVKCASITDISVIALANANRRPRMRRDAHGNLIPGEYSTSQSCLERVHLSYCTLLTQTSIIRLLNCCPRLTHLSLTGVQAFLRDDLETFSRPAPREFTEHQRSVFCVFSGQGVVNLRKHFNRIIAAEDARRRAPIPVLEPPIFPATAVPPPPLPAMQTIGAGFDDGEPDTMDDEDILDDGSEMVIDVQPLLNHQNAALPFDPATLANMPRHPGRPVSPDNPFAYVAGHPPYVPITFLPRTIPGTQNTPVPHYVPPTGEAEGVGNGSAGPAAANAAVPSGAASNATAGVAIADGQNDPSTSHSLMGGGIGQVGPNGELQHDQGHGPHTGGGFGGA